MSHPFGSPLGLPFPIVGLVLDQNAVAVPSATVSVQNLDKTHLPALTATTDAGGYYAITMAEWDIDDALAISATDNRFASSNVAREFPYILPGETHKEINFTLGPRQLWYYAEDVYTEQAVDDASRAEIILDNYEGRYTAGGTSSVMGESFKQGDKLEVWLLDPDDLDLDRVYLGFIDQQPKQVKRNYQNTLTIRASNWVRQWSQVRVYDIWETSTPGVIMADILKELTADGTFDGGTDIDNGSTSITKFVSDGLTVFECAKRLAAIDGHYFGERTDRASAYDRKPFFRLISSLATDPAAVASDKPQTWNIVDDVRVGSSSPQRANAIAIKGGTSGGNQYTVYAHDFPDYNAHGRRETKLLDATLFSKVDILASGYGLVADESAARIAGQVTTVGDTRALLEKTWQLTVSRVGLAGFKVRAKRYGHNVRLRGAILENFIEYDEVPLTTPVVLQEIARRVAALEQGQADTITIPLDLLAQDNTYSPANWLTNVDNIAFYTSTTLISTASNYAETTNGQYAIFTGELAAAYGNGVTIASVMLRDGSTIKHEYGLPRPIAKTASKTVHVTATVYTTT